MAVIRVSKTKGFTVMSNYHLRDKELSLKAKGLLSMMLTLPDGWHYNLRGLASICKEGVTSISSAVRELVDCGYIKRHQPVVGGKFQEIEYVIYEYPQRSADGNDGQDPDPDDKLPLPSPEGLPSDAEGDDESAPTYSPVHVAAGGAAPAPAAGADCPSEGSVCQAPAYPGTPNPVPAYAEEPCTGFPHTDSLNAYINKDSRKKERVNTDQSNYPSINHRRTGISGAVRGRRPDGMDGMDSRESELLSMLGARRNTDAFGDYRELVEENIGFNSLCLQHEFDRSTLDGIVDLMVETICSKSPYVRINGQDVPQAVVKSRFLKLNSGHIEYVLTCLSNSTNRIRNIRQYLLTTLYNSPTTMDAYYQNWVQSDAAAYAAAI